GAQAAARSGRGAAQLLAPQARRSGSAADRRAHPHARGGAAPARSRQADADARGESAGQQHPHRRRARHRARKAAHAPAHRAHRRAHRRRRGHRRRRRGARLRAAAARTGADAVDRRADQVDRMSPRIHYAALALLLVAGGGCSKARTEAVVVITTDGVRIPDDVEKITLTVADVNDEGSPVFGHDFPICGGGVTDGCFTLPLEFTLIPGPHRDHSSRVEVVATRGGMPVIDDAAIFTFAEGKSLRLDFVLYDNCLGSDCATHDQTCGPDAQCTNVPAVLISGDPDLSASPPDLGSGGDAGADDLSVPAGDLAAADLSMPADLTVHDFANCVPLCVAGTCGDNGCGTPCMCAANQTCQGTTCVANSTDMATTGDKVLNWTASTSYDTGAFYGVWGLSTTVYAVGDPGSANNPIWKHAIAGGDLMFSADTANTVDTTKTLRGIWGTSKTNVYAVGDSATMLRLNTNWSIVALGTNFPASYPLNGVWIGNPGSPTIWAVGGTSAANCTGTSDYNHFGTSWDQPFSTASGCAYGAV